MSGPVRSLSQGFAILRLLAEAGPLTLSDIGRRQGLSPSSCLNLLRTLVAEGAAERDPRSKHYRLTPAWAAAEVLRDGREHALIERALPPMTRLAETFDAAVGLWKIASRERTHLIGHGEGKGGMRLRLADAQRQPLGGGAVGRALAAAEGVGEAEMRRRFAGVRWQTPLSFDDYAGQVGLAARRGFAVDAGFAHRGVTTVASAVPGAHPRFALSASILAESRSEEEVDALGGELVRLCGTFAF